jgi:S1-C subfamily serine protease
VEQGILVAQLYRDGPADVAGVRGATQQVVVGNRRFLIGGDIITAVDNHPIADWNALSAYLELNTQVGQAVTLALLRDGRPLELDVTLAAQP